MTKLLLKAGTDTGKSHTKYSLKNGSEFDNHEFKTNVKSSEDAEPTGKGFVLNYKGNRYIIGEDTEKTTTDANNVSKLNLDHKLCVLGAICKMIKKSGLEGCVDIHTTVNMPLSEYLSKSDRQELANMYNGSYNLIMNDEDFTFNLTVTPYFEGYGLAIKHSNRIGEGKNVVVLEFGSLNVGVVFYDGLTGRPMPDQSDTLDYGFESLKRLIRSSLKRDTRFKNIKLSLRDIEQMMTLQKFPSLEMEELILEVVNSHLENILGELAGLNITLQNSEFLISGGSTIPLKSYLLKYYNNPIVDPDRQYVNSKYTMELI